MIHFYSSLVKMSTIANRGLVTVMIPLGEDGRSGMLLRTYHVVPRPEDSPFDEPIAEFQKLVQREWV